MRIAIKCFPEVFPALDTMTTDSGNRRHIRVDDESISLEGSFIQENIYVTQSTAVFVSGDLVDNSGEHLIEEPAKYLFNSYRQENDSFLENLHGHFAAIILDLERRKLIAINDKFCTRPLFYSESKGRFHLAFNLGQLATSLPSAPKVSAQSIYHYIFFHCIPSPDTIYEGVYKLTPATRLSFDGSMVQKELYWKPEFSEEDQADQKILRQEMRSALKNNIELWASGPGVGAFLSGGLDSSSVTAFLSRSSSQPARTFTIGFDEEGYDESGFAKVVADEFSTDHTVKYVTPADILSALPKIAAYYDEPFGNSSALPAYFCALAAKDKGVHTLLAGDGGDELYAGNERYAKQKLFEPYQKLPSPIRSLVKGLVSTAKRFRLPLANKADSYLFQANQSVVERLQFYNFLHQFNADEVFQPHILAGVDQKRPMQLLKDRYNEVDAGLVDNMLYLDWKFTLADNDLVKVNTMTRLAGVEVKYPMLNDSLLENSLRVSPGTKLPGNKLRKFFKDAMGEILPDATINKTKKGFGLPFGKWLRKDPALVELAQKSLENLQKRDIFQPEFLRKVRDMHSQVHASYFGELVWILMMLELWMDSHAPQGNLRSKEGSGAALA